MENQINLLSEEEGVGFAPLQAKTDLLRMEERSNRLIKEKEEMWRLKSRAVWMKSGDENNFFFNIMQKIESFLTPFIILRTNMEPTNIPLKDCQK